MSENNISNNIVNTNVHRKQHEQMYSCLLCDAAFTKQSRLDVHIRRKHATCTNTHTESDKQ